MVNKFTITDLPKTLRCDFLSINYDKEKIQMFWILNLNIFLMIFLY